MLEGLKGDAGEVTRLAARATDLDRPTRLDASDTNDQQAAPITVRRAATLTAVDGDRPNGARLPELSARPVRTAGNGVRERLQAAFARGRPDGGAWTARTLAEAASCGRSSAAAFLQSQRQGEEDRS
jgi:hypothetical protein